MNNRSTINQVAFELAKIEGWPVTDGYDFVSAATLSPPPEGFAEYKNWLTGGRFLSMAETAFEIITGDSPDYS